MDLPASDASGISIASRDASNLVGCCLYFARSDTATSIRLSGFQLRVYRGGNRCAGETQC